MILDITAGYRMMYFNKFNNENILFCDIRSEVNPDINCSNCYLPFQDNIFDLVVFDPPHLTYAGPLFREMFGLLNKESWPRDIKLGIGEGLRVLKPNHFLIFKWSSHDINLKQLLKYLPDPLFGQITKENYNRNKKGDFTYWLTFIKEGP